LSNGDLDIVGAETKGLFCAVCFITAVASDDARLWSLFSDPRLAMQGRFREQTEFALTDAGFPTTKSISVLQSLMLYLIALQSLWEEEMAWSMLGVAIRVARSMGLPCMLERDLGDSATSPYDK